MVSTNPATLLGYGTWAQIATGRFLVGFDSGNPNFDTLEEVGGSASATPAGTVSQPTFTGNALGTHTHTFSGSALANHAHELPFQIASTTSIRQIASGTFGTGTSRAATAQQTTTANTTSAAVALSQAVSAGTPAGTNSAVSAGTPAGTVSQPTFTGNSMSTIPPYFTILAWKRTA